MEATRLLHPPAMPDPVYLGYSPSAWLPAAVLPTLTVLHSIPTLGALIEMFVDRELESGDETSEEKKAHSHQGQSRLTRPVRQSITEA